MVQLLMNTRLQGNGRTRGFTLVEVLVSMTILAVGILLLGNLLVRSARTADNASAVAFQTAAMAAAATRYDAIPFDQLAAGTVCTNITTPPLPATSCVTVTNVSAKIRRVSVVVTPTTNSQVPVDSVVFERSTGNPSPLNTP
jgi:prepilin-type N-terminal cleavage/methylation domain-containing protein